MTCAVIDIGKTHARVSLVEPSGELTFQQRCANRVVSSGAYPRFDVDQMFAWILDALVAAHGVRGIRSLICATHGAAGALTRGDELALPVMDYEWVGPGSDGGEYDRARDPFEQTLSPRLAAGLNLAQQLWWQRRIAPEKFHQADRFLTYPQYWAWRLCGEAASEVSSLGSHSDLWRPLVARPSKLAVQLGIAERLPPLRHASDVLGRLRASSLRLPESMARINVHCGVHDSSAAYVAHCPDPAAPGVVVSTGTWVVCMGPMHDAARLDPARDLSGTVSIHGAPLASSRFMGGREFAAIAGAEGVRASADASHLSAVLDSELMVLPSFAAGGPFQALPPAGLPERIDELDTARRHAIAALYCALVTDVCLEGIGATGTVIVDGTFAGNAVYLGALAALREKNPICASCIADGTTVGSASVVFRERGLERRHRPVAPMLEDAVRRHRDRWRAAITQRAG